MIARVVHVGGEQSDVIVQVNAWLRLVVDCFLYHLAGTIRKTQHAAIAHDRQMILEAAQKPDRRASDDTVDTILKQSEQALMAMEA